MLPENTIITGDSLEVMKDWPDNCVDLVVCSPPYNLAKQYDNYHDMMDWKSFIVWNSLVLRQLKRIATHIVWIIGSQNNMEYYVNLYRVLGELGNHKVIYAPRYLYMNPVELALYFWPDNWSWNGKHKPPLLLNGQTPHWLPVVFGKVENLYSGHPATFPERYPTYFIESFTEENDVVLDCFSGTGTTCKVAKEMKRRYIGIDISPEYCEIARQRLEAVDTGVSVKEQRKGQQALFPKE